MRRNKAERKLIKFLQTYPNQWHGFRDDATTLRAVAVLSLLHGLKVNMTTLQMFWPGAH